MAFAFESQKITFGSGFSSATRGSTQGSNQVIRLGSRNFYYWAISLTLSSKVLKPVLWLYVIYMSRLGQLIFFNHT